MDDKLTSSSSKQTPKWLKRVQQNSWEPEILLSGLVLIGLLQLPEKIKHFSNFMRAEALSGNLTGAFTGLEQVVYILIFGLLIHLFLRSVWVGLIGLTYTFPEGIRVEKLGYQPKFEQKVKSLSTLENQIIMLEKICSSIFATCFFLIMLILGVVLSVILFVASLFLLEFILNLLGSSLDRYLDTNIDAILSVIFFILVIDFVGMGLYRKNQYVAKVYYPIHRFLGWITFSRFYRTIYYVFASNIKKGYLILFFILFIAFSFLGQVQLQKNPDESAFSFIKMYSRIAETTLFSGYYEDRNEHWTSYMLETPSPIVTGRFMELRLKHQLSLERQMIKACGLEADEVNANDLKASQAKLACINQVYALLIDGRELENPDWLFYFHQQDQRKGFITFIDVGDLPPGRHRIEVQVKSEDPVLTVGSVPFVKE